ncbi:MAG: methylated-DNA--[protein]-cysteine S-methyltransferase [Ignavibacteriales bacterium]|nr:methylated-DNA--[protein]-cysteine S-methyltransferase [Ignavibacteriales bacterium]
MTELLTEPGKQRMRLGTYELIWETVRHVPKGKVATYGQIASEAGFPRQPRLVGYALHALPPRSGVPWHRVINAKGRVSFPKDNAAYKKQRRLLKAEGIVFRGEAVDMERYGWLSDL